VSSKRLHSYVHREAKYVHGWYTGGERRITNGRTKAHKHFRLNAAKLRRAQRVLCAGSETETVERALDRVITEYERNRITAEANDRLIKSGVAIKDVYGVAGEVSAAGSVRHSIYITALRTGAKGPKPPREEPGRERC
jgi:hypothetical protein